MHIIFVAQSAPKAEGNGSNHRAYQIAHDLSSIAGEANLTIFDYGAEAHALAAARPVERFSRQQASRLGPGWQEKLTRLRRSFSEQKYNGQIKFLQWRRLISLAFGGLGGANLPGGSQTLGRHYNDPRVLARYFGRVGSLPRPLICVVRHSSFTSLAPANRRLGIPTIACPANLEALDVGVSRLDGSARQLYLLALKLGDELNGMAACDARLFISRVETGLVNGLGMPSEYYPYRPVGEIRQNMLAVRQARTRSAPRPGLFIMLGSANHPTTARSFRWFLGEAARYGLPDGVRLLVCGRDTDQLAAAAAAVPGVELRGWVGQEELNGLLAAAQGVLLPQQTGFGGLTRLAELSCAHVPGIVSTHAAYAIQPMPPGFILAGDSWAAWRDGLAQFAQGQPAAAFSDGAYERWESSQAQPLAGVLAQLGGGNFAQDSRINP